MLVGQRLWSRTSAIIRRFWIGNIITKISYNWNYVARFIGMQDSIVSGYLFVRRFFYFSLVCTNKVSPSSDHKANYNRNDTLDHRQPWRHQRVFTTHQSLLHAVKKYGYILVINIIHFIGLPYMTHTKVVQPAPTHKTMHRPSLCTADSLAQYKDNTIDSFRWWRHMATRRSHTYERGY